MWAGSSGGRCGLATFSLSPRPASPNFISQNQTVARPSGERRHQVGAGRARPRHPRADGGPGAGEGVRLAHHAGSRARAEDGAAGGVSGAAGRGAAGGRRGGGARGVLASPIVPGLNDHELERILEAGAGAGASCAGWLLVRLPHEVAEIFEAWLRVWYPARAERVLGRIRQMRGGKLNDPRFGGRHRGSGVWAELLARRFVLACSSVGALGLVGTVGDLLVSGAWGAGEALSLKLAPRLGAGRGLCPLLPSRLTLERALGIRALGVSALGDPGRGTGASCWSGARSGRRAHAERASSLRALGVSPEGRSGPGPRPGPRPEQPRSPRYPYCSVR